MQCKNCHVELEPDSIFCAECGTPVIPSVAGFGNMYQILRLLKTLIDQNQRKVIVNTAKFVALINDYLVDYDKERRLLVYVLNAGILKNMVYAEDHKLAVMMARSSIMNDCYIAENAAEFVLVCITYVMGWEYEQTITEEKPEEPSQAAEEIAEEKPAEPAKSGPLNIEARIMRPGDAVRFRIARNVTIPEGYTKIEGFCFDGFSSMRTIKLPSTLLAIGDYAFSSCKHLKGVELPPTLKIIRQGAFSQCLDLTVIKIPSGILEIEDNTFLCCQSLEVVEVPSTVSSIGAQAFSGCEKLRRLFLPESVKFIDDNAFMYCPELTIRCYENSYVHKYCLSKGIKFETVEVGADLRSNMNEGGQV